MPRLRFIENHVNELLTFLEYMRIYYEELLIFHYTAQKLSY
jgi:hypothetical protein